MSTTIGNECPKCNERLEDDGACVTPGCGWHPTRTRGPKFQACAGTCGESFSSRQLHACDDGKDRCGACHMRFLRARMASDEDRCPDGVTVREKKAELAEILSRGEAKWASYRVGSGHGALSPAL